MAEAADLDGDGLLDLATIDENVGTAIYFGQRDGSFSAAVRVADAKPAPYALAVADVNRDGKLEVVFHPERSARSRSSRSSPL